MYREQLGARRMTEDGRGNGRGVGMGIITRCQTFFSGFYTLLFKENTCNIIQDFMSLFLKKDSVTFL